jgi:hypothetical protein
LRPDETPYSAVEQFVSGQLTGTDNAYIDYAAFYPAKSRARNVYFLRYLEYAMTPEEKKSVTVLVISPEHLADATNKIAGNWQLTAELKESTGRTLLPAFLARHIQSKSQNSVYAAYHLGVYRKAPALSTP